MGFYLRKSIKVGPLRFNVSKSGVSITAGVAGPRFGFGPRGNYVRMGQGGLSYYATLPSSVPAKVKLSPLPVIDPSIPTGTHAPLEEIESADTSKIVDSSSRELLDELNTKRAEIRLWPFALAVDKSVPRDAEIIDRTWRYVNKSGGSDKRFKDNKQLPICRYEQISISSSTGLNEALQVSRCGFGEQLSSAIYVLANKVQ